MNLPPCTNGSEYRNQLILSNQALVETIVQEVIGRYGIRHYHDDLLGAGLLGLTKACDRISERPEEIPVSVWLRRQIKAEIQTEVSYMFLIRVPDRSLRRKKDAIKMPKRVAFADRRQLKGLMNEGLREFEDREAVERFLYNETERTIIRKRFEGYSDPEISEAIGVSVQTVNRIRHEIARRFENESTEKGWS